MNAPARQPADTAPERVPGLERAAYVSLLAFAAAPQFSIAALRHSPRPVGAVVDRGRRPQSRTGRGAARCSGRSRPMRRRRSSRRLFSVDPRISFADCKQLLLFAIVPIAYRLLPRRAQPHRRRRGHHRRRAERGLRDRPVRHPGLRQRGQAGAGQPRPLHDLLRGHHAGRVHRGRARDVPAARASLGRARAAGASSSRSCSRSAATPGSARAPASARSSSCGICARSSAWRRCCR